MNNLALFDLDNTLLAGDSDVEWPRFLINQGVLDAEYYHRENDRFYQQYKTGTLDIYEFLDFQLALLHGFHGKNWMPCTNSIWRNIFGL